MPRPTVSDRVRLALPIVLIGPMGAGKSRVGQRLAASVGAPFIDTDQRIDAAARVVACEIGRASCRERVYLCV